MRYLIIGIIVLGALLKGEMACFGADVRSFTASWYSVESLKQEGTYKYSKGVMANGDIFGDSDDVCASCDYRLGTRLLVKYKDKSVVVRVCDRTNKRFKGKRIDLSKGAFSKLATVERGIIEVKVEEII